MSFLYPLHQFDLVVAQGNSCIYRGSLPLFPLQPDRFEPKAVDPALESDTDDAPTELIVARHYRFHHRRYLQTRQSLGQHFSDQEIDLALVKARTLFLETLSLKTLIVLGPITEETRKWCESSQVDLVQFQVKEEPFVPVSETILFQVLRILIKETYRHPVLLVCETGHLVTGVIIACYRKCHHWPLSMCLSEVFFQRISRNLKFTFSFDDLMAADVLMIMNYKLLYLTHVLFRKSLIYGMFRFVQKRFFALNAAQSLGQKGELLGQATFWSHPHLFPSENAVYYIAPSVTRQAALERRHFLASKMPSESALFIGGYQQRFRHHNIFYPFHQNPDFYYLTGCLEQDAALLIEKSQRFLLDSSRDYRVTLFVKPRDPQDELWHGPTTGPERAKDYFSVDDALANNQILQTLKNITIQYPILFWSKRPESSVTLSSSSYCRILSSDPLTHSLRVVKSPLEIECMQRASHVTANGFKEMMKMTRNGVSESALAARLAYESRLATYDAMGLAYEPVVAGGSRGTTLHYTQNNHILSAGDLVLVDAGAQYAGYCSDVSRTWPVNGKFSPVQRALYNAVLQVQLACIGKCAMTGMTLDALHQFSVEAMQEQLSFTLDRQVTLDEVQRWYPHSIGHYLGLDVHDCATISGHQRLRPGMVVTIEPGVYFRRDDVSVPSAFRGLAIRIEDDIFIREKLEPLILTSRVPKTIDELETVINSSSSP